MDTLSQDLKAALPALVSAHHRLLQQFSDAAEKTFNHNQRFPIVPLDRRDQHELAIRSIELGPQLAPSDLGFERRLVRILTYSPSASSLRVGSAYNLRWDNIAVFNGGHLMYFEFERTAQ